MTDRALFWRCIMRLARSGKEIGLSDRELATLLVQAGADHAVWAVGPRVTADWLHRWADGLSANPREFRGNGYAWLDEQ